MRNRDNEENLLLLQVSRECQTMRASHDHLQRNMLICSLKTNTKAGKPMPRSNPLKM